MEGFHIDWFGRRSYPAVLLPYYGLLLTLAWKYRAIWSFRNWWHFILFHVEGMFRSRTVTSPALLIIHAYTPVYKDAQLILEW